MTMNITPIFTKEEKKNVTVYITSMCLAVNLEMTTQLHKLLHKHYGKMFTTHAQQLLHSRTAATATVSRCSEVGRQPQPGEETDEATTRGNTRFQS